MNYYQRLGVAPDASPLAIEQAYRAALAERPPGGPARWRAWLQGRSTAQLNWAYAVLRDPVKRARYDHQQAMATYFPVPPCH